MAQLPGTQFATAQPSGRTGQTLWGPPPRGEGQEIAEGISKLGSAILAYSLKVQDQEMTAEYYEKQRLIDEAGWAAREAVTGDEEADNALWEKAQSDFRAIASSSKYKDVNDRLTQTVNQVSPNWAHGIRTASLQIRANNAEAQQKYNLLMALENGDQQTFDKIIEEGERTKTITPAEKEHYAKYGKGYGALARAERFVANNQYNLALSELDKTDKMDLTTEQLKDKQVLRLEVNKQKDKNDEKLVMDINAMLAEDKYPLHDVLDLIVKRTDLDATQKTKLAETAIAGNKIWNQTGEDVFNITQDYPKLVDTWYKIKTGQIKEFQSLYDIFRSGRENSPAFSFGYMQQLENLRIATTRGTTAAGQLIDLKYRGKLFDSYVKDGRINPKDYTIFKEANAKLDGILQQYRSDPVKLEDEFQKLLTERKETKAKEWLSGLAGIKKGLGYAARPGTMIADLWSGNYMRTTSQEKYKIGDIVSKGGKTWKILTLTSDGQPDDVEEVQ